MIVTASVVLYKTNSEDIYNILTSLTGSPLISTIFIVDNSPEMVDFDFSNFENVKYIKSDNIGYGAGHNLVLNKIVNQSSYHLVLNPDVTFSPLIINKLIEKMQSDHKIGLLMPKILNNEHLTQKLCKLIPNPINLFIRRFKFPLISDSLSCYNSKYEMDFADYNLDINSPTLSGCFMFIRVRVLLNTGFFDERFFMYLEDVDFSRRIHEQWKTIYFPHVVAYHTHAKSSYKSLYMLYLHLLSSFKYFNKWGWFFDKKRVHYNKIAVDQHSTK